MNFKTVDLELQNGWWNKVWQTLFLETWESDQKNHAILQFHRSAALLLYLLSPLWDNNSLTTSTAWDTATGLRCFPGSATWGIWTCQRNLAEHSREPELIDHNHINQESYYLFAKNKYQLIWSQSIFICQDQRSGATTLQYSLNVCSMWSVCCK